MAYDITRLMADLEGIGHGTTINQVTGVYNLINRAARQILLDVDPQETKRTVPLGSQLFQNVFEYPCPTDLKGNKIIDIKPQVDRKISDQFSQTYNQQFDVYKNKHNFPMFTLNFNTAIKTILISKNLITPIIVNNADQINDNGTWSLGGDATDLTQDNINFVVSSSSLMFNVSGATGTSYLENSTMAAVDLTNDLTQGVEFFWVYLSNPTDTTSVNLRWGSSSTDYWTGSATTDWTGNAFVTGWNQIGIEWETASVVGTPDVTAVNYLRCTFSTTPSVAISNMRINGFSSNLGSIYNVEYYSKYIFRNPTTGAFQETVLTNSDLINLDTESYNLLTNQCAVLMAQQQQGNDSGFDYKFFEQKYQDALARYKGMYKSEIIKPQQAYYKRTSNNFRRWFGTGPRGGNPQ